MLYTLRGSRVSKDIYYCGKTQKVISQVLASYGWVVSLLQDCGDSTCFSI